MTEQLVSSLWLSSRGGGTFRERGFALDILAKDISELAQIPFFLEWPVMEIRGGILFRRRNYANFASVVGGNFRPEATGSPRLRQQPSLRRKVARNFPLSLFSVRQRRNEMHSPALWSSIRYRSESLSRMRGNSSKSSTGRSSSREEPDISHNYWRRLPGAAWDSRE